MSVWSSPCYAIEPLRNVANCLPRSYGEKIPSFLKGAADFEFGNCEKRHSERSGRNAYEFFSANPDEWRKFFYAGRANLEGSDAELFANTFSQANVKHAGIRCVYWAFKNFRERKWEATVKAKSADIVKAASTFFNLGAAPSRINQGTWDEYKAWIEKDAEDVNGWAKAEELADAVRYMWSLKESKKQRTLKKKMVALHQSMFGSKTYKVRTDFSALSLSSADQGNGRGLAMATKAERKAIMTAVRNGVPVSLLDAKKVAILPHVAVPNANGRLIVFSYRGGLILYDSIIKEGGLLTQKEYDRLVQMLQSDAKLKMYFSKYDELDHSLSSVMARKYEEIMSLAMAPMSCPTHLIANNICRAFDVCQFLFLANLASDVTNDAIECQMAKIASERLMDVIDIDTYLSIIDDDELGVKESLELAKFCKIFPCPDFCIYSVVDGIEKKSENAHPSSEFLELKCSNGKTATLSDGEFDLYCMRNRAFSFYEVHGFLPGKLVSDGTMNIPTHLLAYPNVSLASIMPHDMAFIDMKGSFNYRHYAGCEVELVKDKVIAPTIAISDPRGNNMAKYSKVEKNQVLKYLFDPAFVPQDELAKLATNGKLFTEYTQMIALALKPEAKKPGSRPFSMASDELRRLLSEAEANIATYVTRQKGSSQGKSTMELTARMATLAGTPTYTEDAETYMMSFDLEGFSPMQSIRFKQRAIRSWSRCFDTPEFDATVRIFTDTTLYFEKFDVSDTFKMVGNDLEGFHGRLNTAAHIDLMGYAVFKLKELGLTKGAAGLEVLIDDGLLRMEIMRGKDHCYAKEVITLIDEIYHFAGQNISWDKTFVSQVMCQYLNRVYYDGVEVSPGAKAFLRIGKNQECAIPTLSDELMAHASTTRGAIQSGANHMMSYYAYMVEVYKTLAKWGLKDVGDESLANLALGLVIPVGLGGLGISTLFGLSTNESLCSLQSGIAAVKMIVKSFPGYTAMAETYLNANMRELDAEGILRNPMAMRTEYRCLNVRRFANVAKAVILKTSTNTLIMEAARGEFDGTDNAIIATIANDRHISEVKRKYLWDMTISSHLDTVVGKLQSSSTAADLIGYKRTLSLYVANRSEARMLLKEISTGTLSVRYT